MNDARERMLRELTSELANMVAAGEWFNMKAEQWKDGV